jgi:hypothetical protein
VVLMLSPPIRIAHGRRLKLHTSDMNALPARQELGLGRTWLFRQEELFT